MVNIQTIQITQKPTSSYPAICAARPAVAIASRISGKTRKRIGRLASSLRENCGKPVLSASLSSFSANGLPL
jgi:hypothetical protein